MAQEDEDMTAFRTDTGIYCYTKMPFGLKNAGATYQHLIDQAFINQVDVNLEIYVDDLVIKSREEDLMLLGIQRTFDQLLDINMAQPWKIFLRHGRWQISWSNRHK